MPETRWKRNFDRRFKIKFQFLLPHDQKVIWDATTKVCNAEDPAVAYPHEKCAANPSHAICAIGEGYILAFEIDKENSQVHFVGFYRKIIR